MKGIKYTEPKAYMPKEIVDKYFGKTEKKSPAKKTGTKKNGKKKTK